MLSLFLFLYTCTTKLKQIYSTVCKNLSHKFLSITVYAKVNFTKFLDLPICDRLSRKFCANICTGESFSHESFSIKSKVWDIKVIQFETKCNWSKERRLFFRKYKMKYEKWSKIWQVCKILRVLYFATSQIFAKC